MKKQILVVLLALPLIAASGKVKMYLDESFTESITVNKLDCKVHNVKKKGITIGFKVGNLLFNAGPEIGFHNEEGIQWDKALHGIIMRYQSLCSRFNTGSITKDEYDSRWQEFMDLGDQVIKIQREQKKRVRDDAMEAFRMLDSDVGLLGMKVPKKEFDSTNVSRDIDFLIQQVEDLPPIKIANPKK